MSGLHRRLDALEKNAVQGERQAFTAIFARYGERMQDGTIGNDRLGHIAVNASSLRKGAALDRLENEALPDFLERAAVEHRRVYGYLPDEWFDYGDQPTFSNVNNGVVVLDRVNLI